MLLYITVDDVLGSSDGTAPRPDPRQPLPGTLAALFDRAMRHHSRRAALLRFEPQSVEVVPDWRLDRLAIRVALYCREHLGLDSGAAVGILGPPGWLWPVVECAALGSGAVAVGFEHEIDDASLAQALVDSAPRVVFAGDEASAARLRRLREAGVVPAFALVPVEGDAPGASTLPVALELGAALDTAERAQTFRTGARALPPEAPALWHFASDGSSARLTHAAAVESLATRLLGAPTAPDTLAVVAPRRMTLAARLACQAFLGTGNVTLGLGHEERVARELPALRPHALLASAAWGEALWRDVLQASTGLRRRLALAWPSPALRRLDHCGPLVRQALASRLGDRLQILELEGSLEPSVAAGLSEAGLDDRRG